MAALLAASGCAAPLPTGPQVLVLPGKGKSLAAFQADDAVCRQFAVNTIGGNEARAPLADDTLQTRYDVAYVQCMAAKGDELPKMLAPPPVTRLGSPYAWWPYAWPYYPAYVAPPFFSFGSGFVFIGRDGFRHRRHFVRRHHFRQSWHR